MRSTRLYSSEKLECGTTTQLSAEASNHLIRVLRTNSESEIILFNGDGYDYLCRTLDENPKKTLIEIHKKTQPDNESNLSITLIQGLSRLDRMEATIQKSVELGVNKIIPVLCQRSNTRLSAEKKIKKLSHWRKVVISACEQSGRSIVPQITEILPLSDIQTLLNPAAQKINLYPESSTSLKIISKDQQAIELLIGPEGGLNEKEIDLLDSYDFINVRFGPRILRTETAGPAVISALQILRGDF